MSGRPKRIWKPSAPPSSSATSVAMQATTMLPPNNAVHGREKRLRTL